MVLVEGLAVMGPLVITNAVVAAVVALVTWQATADHYQARLARLQADQATSQARAAADAQAAQVAFQTQLQEARNAAVKREAALRRDVGAARDALYGLRGAAERARRELPGYSPAAAAVLASTATDLLAQCADRYRDVAESADRHAGDAVMLQEAWPRHE
ncbi:MAG: hypothetical protein JSS18_10310 [Proteobacteria bacterium]|nr:hypothetical protein [Pseudomonadota bacterium]